MNQINKRPITILHVFDGFRIGGTEVRTARLINKLGQNYHHIIYSLSGNFDAKTHISDTISTQYLTFQPRPANFFKTLFIYRHELKSIKPDILLTYSWGPIEWVIANTLFKRICPIIQIPEGFEVSETYREKPLRRFLRHFFYSRCDALIPCSKVLKEIALSKWGVSPAKIHFIPNGIEFGNNIPQKNTQLQNNISITAVGSLLAIKNHMRLIQAVQDLLFLNKIDIRLQIAGDGPEYDSLNDYIKSNNLSDNIILLGYMKNPIDLLLNTHIFSITSDTEQMPMVVLEAMAVGLPIVGTDVGDIKEMVSDSNKEFIVPTKASNELKNALIKLIFDKHLREQVGNENRQKCFNSYSFEKMTAQYENIILSLIT
jgi:L-malate glycosyltransferase